MLIIGPFLVMHLGTTVGIGVVPVGQMVEILRKS
jgi:hypothetical protein